MDRCSFGMALNRAEAVKPVLYLGVTCGRRASLPSSVGAVSHVEPMREDLFLQAASRPEIVQSPIDSMGRVRRSEHERVLERPEAEHESP